MFADVLCETATVPHWGSRVRDERERRGWTRVALAERIGATEGTIRLLEDKPSPPVRSKYAPLINELFGIGDDVVASQDPRLSEASARQLAQRLAEILAEDADQAPRHDQSNVRAFEWTDVPEDQTQSWQSVSPRALYDTAGEHLGDDAPPSPA